MTNTCPSCSGGSLGDRKVNSCLRIMRCEDCGFLTGMFSVKHGPGAGYSQLDPRAYERSIASLREEEGKVLTGYVRALDPQPRVWLDIGCGAGKLLGQVAADFEAYGVEPDELAQNLSIAASPTARVAARIEDLELSAGCVGVVSMLDVLEHVEPKHLAAVAANILELISPKGFWLIKVPSSDGLYFRLAHLLSRIAPRLMEGTIGRLWLLNYPSPHYCYFNEQALRRFLCLTGFEVVSTFYLPTLPINTAVSRLTLDRAIPRWKALAALPLVLLIAVAERIRGRTDSLVVVARRSSVAQ